MTEDLYKVVGHKTFANDDGTFRHEPLYKNEADAIWAACEAKDKARAEEMPDVETALSKLFDAYERLKQLGFQDARYAPKDTALEVIELGSTGIHPARRGLMNTGGFWVEAKGDLWPCKPALFRLADNAELRGDS